MNYYELTKEEKELLKAVESGEFRRVKNFKKEKSLAVAIARNTLNKTKNINIRLTEKSLIKLKSRAAREGIPYQTLVASILHQHAV